MIGILKKIIIMIKGLWSTFFMIMKIGIRKPITLEYPERKKEYNENLRGKLMMKYNESGDLTCNGCGLCVKCCPVNGAIKIEKTQAADGKMKVSKYSVDLSQCIFCGNCVYICPGDNIYMTKEYELAQYNKENLKCEFEAKRKL